MQSLAERDDDSRAVVVIVEANHDAFAPSIPVLLLAITLMHATFWSLPTPDYVQFLRGWYYHIVESGLPYSFSQPFSNYSPAYLYLLAALTFTQPFLDPLDAIKALSLLGNVWLAFAVYDLLHALKVPNAKRQALLVLVLPTAVAQVVFFSQCDALWAAPCVLGVAAAVRHKHGAMLAWAAIGFAFKAQAAFVAPFLFAILLARKVPLTYWAIPPLVVLAVMFPAWLAGWPAVDLLLVYIRQGSQLPSYISNAPNLWAFGAQLAPEATLQIIPAGFLFSTFVAGALVWKLRRYVNDTRGVVAAALLSVLIMPFVLPKMHERYFFLADILAVVLTLAAPGKNTMLVAALTTAGSSVAIVAYLWQLPLLILAGTLAMAPAILLTLACLRQSGTSQHPTSREVVFKP